MFMHFNLLFRWLLTFISVLSDRVAQRSCYSFTLRSSLDVVVSNTTFYPAGDRVDIANDFSFIATDDLPAFCRVQLLITTNSTANSTAVAEVWLPTDWSGRILGIGNGGFGGGVTVADLGHVAVRQKFVGISTDTGHASNATDGSWGGPHNDNAIIDWSWRALHLSVVAGKEVVRQFYGKSHGKAYYMGCSTGGRQGLLEVQRFPEEFDGVVVGAPANWMSHLQVWTLHTTLSVLPVDSPHWIPPNLWSNIIHPEVLRQCDHLDGLVDSIIVNPRICNFRPETLACRPTQNRSTCLTIPQIEVVHKVYADYYEANQTYIFSGYYPGGEEGYSQAYLSGKLFLLTLDYVRYLVLNDTTWTIDQFGPSTIEMSDLVNPGASDAIDPNIISFAGPTHNGKLLHYFGWSDQLISAGDSIRYYDMVHAFTRAHTEMNINDFYRLFPVPGMEHCRGGFAANAFGGVGQAASGMPPSSFDATHNVLDAIVDWVENGMPPDTMIASHYSNNNVTEGVDFTRPLCLYPKHVSYIGGDVNVSSSFRCM